MAISNVALTNTFQEWQTVTNQIVVAVNDFAGQGTTIRNVTLGLVNANSVLIGTVNVGATLVAAFAQANTDLLYANLAFDKANSANVQATSAYARANVANTTANTSLLYANLAFDKANSACTKADTAQTTASAAFDKANTTTIGSAAFDTANSAYGQANTALLAAQGAFGKANTINVSTNFSGNISTANANISSQILTDGATISWNTAVGQVATITLSGNRTMAAPTSLKVGTYILHVIQDGVGGRTLAWNSVFKWTAATAPTLTTDANARDVFSFVSDGTNLYGSFLPDVR